MKSNGIKVKTPPLFNVFYFFLNFFSSKTAHKWREENENVFSFFFFLLIRKKNYEPYVIFFEWVTRNPNKKVI